MAEELSPNDATCSCDECPYRREVQQKESELQQKEDELQKRKSKLKQVKGELKQAKNELIESLKQHHKQQHSFQ